MDAATGALPSGWTCLQLVNHLAAEERLWFRGIVAGEPADAVLDRYREEIRLSDAILAD